MWPPSQVKGQWAAISSTKDFELKILTQIYEMYLFYSYTVNQLVTATIYLWTPLRLETTALANVFLYSHVDVSSYLFNNADRRDHFESTDV